MVVMPSAVIFCCVVGSRPLISSIVCVTIVTPFFASYVSTHAGDATVERLSNDEPSARLLLQLAKLFKLRVSIGRLG